MARSMTLTYEHICDLHYSMCINDPFGITRQEFRDLIALHDPNKDADAALAREEMACVPSLLMGRRIVLIPDDWRGTDQCQ
jgi:hypothetical protein